jgi:hypothetical protein
MGKLSSLRQGYGWHSCHACLPAWPMSVRQARHSYTLQSLYTDGKKCAPDLRYGARHTLLRTPKPWRRSSSHPMTLAFSSVRVKDVTAIWLKIKLDSTRMLRPDASVRTGRVTRHRGRLTPPSVAEGLPKAMRYPDITCRDLTLGPIAGPLAFSLTIR